MANFLAKLKAFRLKDSDKIFRLLVNKMVNPLLGWGDIFDDLTDSYCEIGPALSFQLVPGQVYMFLYNSKQKLYINSLNGSGPIEFYDTTPIVLVLENDIMHGTIKGFNLNFCNRGLKVLLLNLMQQIDPSYFDGGAAKLMAQGDIPISKKTMQFLQNPDAVKQIIDALKRMYPDVDYSVIYKTYTLSSIKTPLLIEPWIWEYLPDMEYKGTMNMNIIKQIQKATGIDRIKI